MVGQAALSGDVPVRGLPMDRIRITSLPVLITKAVRPDMDADIFFSAIRDRNGFTLWCEVEIKSPDYADYCDHLIPSSVSVQPAAKVRREGTQALPNKRRSRRRGPKRDSVGYRQADSALFPEMDRLRPKYRSASAVARKLVEEGKVSGAGSQESKVKRLTARYLRAPRRRNPLKLSETR